MPTISIITPLYNAESTLPTCVDSVLGQSFRDFELILVDDSSTDGSAAICQRYEAQDSRVQVVRQSHAGVAAARNTGLARAQGTHISFVDADDFIAPDFLQSLLDKLEATGADIALCACTWVDETGAPIGLTETLRDTTLNSDSALTHLFFHDAKKAATVYTSLCNKLYRAPLFEGIIFPAGRIFEDDAVMYKLMARASAVAVDSRPLYSRRRRPGSLTGTGSPAMFFDKLAADAELVAFARQDDYLFLLPHALQTLWETFEQHQHLYLQPPPELKPQAKQAQKLLKDTLPLIAKHTTFPAAERRRMRTFAYTPWLAKPAGPAPVQA